MVPTISCVLTHDDPVNEELSHGVIHRRPSTLKPDLFPLPYGCRQKVMDAE